MWFDPIRVEEMKLQNVIPAENILPALTHSKCKWLTVRIESENAVLSLADLYNHTFGDAKEMAALFKLYDGKRPRSQANADRTDYPFYLLLDTKRISNDAIRCEPIACYEFWDPSDGNAVFAILTANEPMGNEFIILMCALLAHPFPADWDKTNLWVVVFFKPATGSITLACGEPGHEDRWIDFMSAAGCKCDDCISVKFICNRLQFDGDRLDKVLLDPEDCDSDEDSIR